MLPVPVQNQAALYNDFNALAKLKREAVANSPEALKATAQQFEALFVNQMLKSMREASLGEGLLDSEQSKMYQEMHDQQLSVELSRQSSLGLADMIVKQLGGESDTLTTDSRNLDHYRQHPVTLPQPAPRPSAVLPDTQLPSKRHTAASQVAAPVSTAEPQRPALPQRFDSPQAFIDALYPAAEATGQRLGVDPKLLLAQAALETGWGKAIIQRGDDSSFNLFNIKASGNWSGDKARVGTLEYENGVVQKTHADFRAYQSYQDSFDDYARLLENNRRYANALANSDNPKAFAHALQKAGYATDPNYANKVLSIYQGDTLSNWQPPLTLAHNRGGL
ncbi:MAG: flagellar assembly peptidoglycan hydrolase FlgJ [Methylococcales bacterium]|nr:flagellar assembly peptidoglycan hydrolase FlgJ [Methylococcales bacterium]